MKDNRGLSAACGFAADKEKRKRPAAAPAGKNCKSRIR
jgi:hypothetical protein